MIYFEQTDEKEIKMIVSFWRNGSICSAQFVLYSSRKK